MSAQTDRFLEDVDPLVVAAGIDAIRALQKAADQHGFPAPMLMEWLVAKIVRSMSELVELPIEALLESLESAIEAQDALSDAGMAVKLTVDNRDVS